MKKSTKLLAVLLCLAMVVAMFAACGNKPSEPEAPAEASVADADKVYNIGISQYIQHTALDAATQGFQDKLTELLGEEHVNFNLQNASGDSPTCATIANQFVASGVDLIMANATPSLQTAAAATNEIPVVGTSVTDYATALEITDWTGKTGSNVAGVSDLAPLDQQAAIFTELLPEAKTIGLLYCSGEANSKYQITAVKGYLEEAGLTTIEYSFADSNDIAAVVTKAVDECDALYIPTDNAAANNTEVINNIAEPAGVPIIAGEEGICEGCGIATLSISYYDLGVATAEMAYEILVNGANPGEMEVRYASAVDKKYVSARCEALGITVPDTYVVIDAE